MGDSTSYSECNYYKTHCEVMIGVLAVQGSFSEHIEALKKLGDEIYSIDSKVKDSNKEDIKLKVVDIRSSKDVSSKMRGLIIPGILKCFYLTYRIFENTENVLSFELCSNYFIQLNISNAILGGESTTLNIFLKDNGFFESIQQWIR